MRNRYYYSTRPVAFRLGFRVMPEERRSVRTELAAATGLGKWMRLSKCLTVEETADVLRIVPGTLRQWVRKGTGPKVTRINGCLRFRDDHVQEYIEAHSEDVAA